MSMRYRELVEDVDYAAERITARYVAHLRCRAGCSGCCNHHLSVFEVEAAEVRRALRSLPPETMDFLRKQARETLAKEARGEFPSCPLLVDDLCSIYASRPIICRTQGLPLLITNDDGSREVDFCPLNFGLPNATNELHEDSLVLLESVNERLVRANFEHCAEIGLDRNYAGTRISMAGIIGGS